MKVLKLILILTSWYFGNQRKLMLRLNVFDRDSAFHISAEFTYFNFVKRLNTDAELPLIFILIKGHEAQITFS